MSEESKKTDSGDGQIAMIEARLAELTGLCGDHSCVFGPPKGLGTNGGCRCEVKRNPKVQQAIQLQRKLSTLLRERVETQSEAITAFQSQFRVMKEAIEWQPIETAPKDGPEVLLAHGNSQWIDQWVEFGDGAACWMMCDQWEEPEIPSHWKRLGELPAMQPGD